jgi:predicted alpha/beta superfamily hydrolase
MRTFSAGGRTVSVFPSGEPGAPVIYLNTFSGEGQQVFQAVRDAGTPAFTLVAVSGLDWDHDMAPWDSPPVFQNARPCTGGADGYLELLTGTILPAAEGENSGEPRWRGIAGYSLAGLFAVYAVHRTDLFSRVGSMSGSLWYPGIKEYLFSHRPKRRPDRIYFSLGDRESRTRNPLLKTVRQNTEEIHAFYRSQGIDTVFRLNPGNHYSHGVERTAAGIAWLLGKEDGGAEGLPPP